MMGRRIVLQGREAPRPLNELATGLFNSEQHAFNYFLKQVWWPEYSVWAMLDGYIPVYTVGMVNTRYMPVFMECSDPSTVSQSHRTHRRLSAD